jgi:O-antigen ligase
VLVYLPVIVALALVGGIAILRPGPAVMAAGVLLFVDASVARLPHVPPGIHSVAANLDDAILLGAAARALFEQIRDRRLLIPTPAWALAAMAIVGVLSALVNDVTVQGALVGLAVTVRPGLWLYVGRSMRIRERVVVWYGYLIGGLFLASIGLAVLQVLGVPLPWHEEVRPASGDIAATSIWNQHTVFGTAMSVAAGLALIAIQLRSERRAGLALALAAGLAIILSSTRRLLISIPLGIAALFWAAPPERRLRVGTLLASTRRWPVAAGILTVGGLLVVVLGPRMVRLAADLWQLYVVDAAGSDRWQLYGGAFELLLRSPLLGRGPGTYGSYASVVANSTAYAEVGVHLPNDLKMGAPYAGLIAEYGLAGTLAFVVFLALTAAMLLRIIRGSGSPLTVAVAGAGLAMLVNMTIESVVHPTFADSFVTFFVFLAIGVAASLDAASPPQRPNAKRHAWPSAAGGEVVLDVRSRAVAATLGIALLAIWTFLLSITSWS